MLCDAQPESGVVPPLTLRHQLAPSTVKRLADSGRCKTNPAGRGLSARKCNL